MLRHYSAFRIAILGSTMLGLFLTATTTKAEEVRVHQQVAGSCVTSATYESDCIAEAKGAPGKISYRVRQQAGAYGPASPQCDGFDFEAPLLEAEAVGTSPDLSQLYAVLTSGYSCASLAGPGRTVAEYLVVGGSGRFEGASGTVTLESDNVALSPAPGTSAVRSTLEGQITVP
jgi:hypothetical protein